MSARQPPPPTSHGMDRKLSDVARHVVKPEGIVSTAWPSVAATCKALTISFDQWQDGSGRLILAKHRDGLYAADLIVISIPRQVGKTFLIGWIIFALCIINPSLTVIWTAHRFKLARETFDQMRAMALLPSMHPHVDPKSGITTAAGNEAIRFRNRSRILFGARESGFGLGFTKVGVLVMDEAQRLSQTTMDDLVPTTNAAPNPLIIMTGTPPRPTDNGEVFAQLRRDALSGESEGVLYIELSADPDASIDDVEQLMKANPSVPHRTSMRAIKRMKKALGPESYRREGLGIWDDDIGHGALPKWDQRRADGLELGTPGAVGLAASVDHAWGSIGAADGSPGMVTVGAVDRRPGTAWLVAEAKRIQDTYGCSVIVDKRGPLADLVPTMVDAGVFPTLVDTGEFCDACAQVARAVEEGTLQHAAHPELDDAVHGASWRNIGDRRAFARKTSEISMLEAATLAAWGVLSGLNYDISQSAY